MYLFGRPGDQDLRSLPTRPGADPPRNPVVVTFTTARASLDGFLSTTGTASGDSEEPEDDDSEEADCEFDDGQIVEDLANGPRIDTCKDRRVIAFMRDYLTQAIIEEWDEEERVYGISPEDLSGQIDLLRDWFFADPESQSRCRKCSPDIGRQVRLWNRMALDFPDPIVKVIADKIISIISIPASEASCERSFSRQKRIMGHFRAKSCGDLLLARFTFDSEEIKHDTAD
jgi:hypothetical protein